MIPLWSRTQQQEYRSRVRGVLLGGAIGDALGAGIEFDSLDAIRAAHGPAGVTGYVPAYGRRGAVTDDTQMVLFTVDGLIRAHVRQAAGGWHPPTDVHHAYLRWAATQQDWGPDERRKDLGWLGREEWLYARRAPGSACLAGLSGPDAERLGTLEQPKNPESKGCGTVMRAAPFGLLIGWEPALVCQLAIECSVLTHGHPTGYLAAGAFAVIVHTVLRGGTVEDGVEQALALLAERPGHEETTAALRGALAAVRAGEPSAARVAELGQGWVAEEALAIGVYCTLVAEDVRSGLLLSVNHSGDSDSTGTVCGSLLGALHGETALPGEWLAELEGRGTILQLADDLVLELSQGTELHGPAAGPAWRERYPVG
ncbi:ADP-ribosylglycohydrolase family protein [Kitasatospora viridis]|uniref:ADP-ribosylglycohydrolase n=1 Tax=Kitasatospora viridis TaxID=281105 RepID=A0A561UG47_9ACTN|nr:ADP-ribosylglycohydrolase family protein [Kitasatospora viridis]TWF98330.1 ADP-ribosylglycohydrolase [Kitasatospora viridis]